MAQPDPSQNKYNPNSGSANDALINQMLDAGMSTEQIMAALSQGAHQSAQQSVTPTTDTSALTGDTSGTGGLDLSFLQDQAAATKDQQDYDNLIALYDLINKQGQPQ